MMVNWIEHPRLFWRRGYTKDKMTDIKWETIYLHSIASNQTIRPIPAPKQSLADYWPTQRKCVYVEKVNCSNSQRFDLSKTQTWECIALCDTTLDGRNSGQNDEQFVDPSAVRPLTPKPKHGRILRKFNGRSKTGILQSRLSTSLAGPHQ